MSMKDFVDSWLEEGFCRFRGALNDKSKHENSLIPHLTDVSGEGITPRPLFPTFLGVKDLERNLLVEYLDVIKNGLYFGKDKKKEKALSGTNVDKLTNSKYRIEYNRKNIFLSRVLDTLFEIPDSLVYKSAMHYDGVILKNNFYKKALNKYHSSPEALLKDQSCEAGSANLMDKSIETVPVVCEDKKNVVNSYEMTKNYYKKEVAVLPTTKTFQEYLVARKKCRNYEEFLTAVKTEKILDHLYIIEKILNYNTYKDTILSYNGCSEVTSHSDEPIRLKHHLQFKLSSGIDDYSVTCIDFNHSNPNIFVVGYRVRSTQDWNNESKGKVACWNIHLPEHPECVYETPEAVTCLRFSELSPWLVGVGGRHGFITILHLRRQDYPRLVQGVRHTGTVTGLQWVGRQHGEDTEMLLTVSLDGHILMWNMDIEGQVLRNIQPEGVNQSGSLAAGTCLRMSPRFYHHYCTEPETFLVGTMDGEAFQADLEEPDEYTFTYNCHSGPISDLQWSPLAENVFVTAGTDHMVHWWKVGRNSPCKSIQLSDPALKVSFSHTKSTLMAVLTTSCLYVFDFDVHAHKPVAKMKSNLTCVQFSPRYDWLLLGQPDAVVHLYQLLGIRDLDGQSEALAKTFLPDH